MKPAHKANKAEAEMYEYIVGMGSTVESQRYLYIKALHSLIGGIDEIHIEA